MNILPHPIMHDRRDVDAFSCTEARFHRCNKIKNKKMKNPVGHYDEKQTQNKTRKVPNYFEIFKFFFSQSEKHCQYF